MAHDAEIHADARTAVERQRIVALVAASRADDVAGIGGCAARRNPGQRVGGVIRAQIELGQVARTVDADTMGCGRVPCGAVGAGGLGLEGVDEFAVGHLFGGSTRIRTYWSPSSASRISSIATCKRRSGSLFFCLGIMYLGLHCTSFSLSNSVVLRYRSPVSGKTTRISFLA